MTSIPNYEPYSSARACNMVNKCSRFLLKGEYVGYIITRKCKCSSKPEFNVSMELLPFPVFLHHWRQPCNPHNLKCHLSPKLSMYETVLLLL